MTTRRIRHRTCLRCAHEWWPIQPRKPRICPRCKSALWDEAPPEERKK